MSEGEPNLTNAVNEIMSLPEESFELMGTKLEGIMPASGDSMVQDELRTTKMTVKAGGHTIEIYETTEKGGGLAQDREVFVNGKRVVDEGEQIYSKVIGEIER